MPVRFATNILNISLSLVLIFLVGCAGKRKVPCPWRNFEITANGSDDEWQNTPQYYDKDLKLTVRVANDAKALYLSVSTGDNALIRNLNMSGLTIWLDPEGGKEKTFGIHLPGMRHKRFGAKPTADAKNVRPFGEKRGPGNFDELLPPSPRTPEILYITYKNSTGPLDMTIDEVRRTGIDIGVGQSPESRATYEFTIGFQSAPCLSDLKPGMIVGVCIADGDGDNDRRKKRDNHGPMGPDPRGGGGWNGPGFDDGMGRPSGGPGGAMPGDSARPHPRSKENSLEIWLKIELAGQVS